MEQINETEFYKAKSQVLADNLSRAIDEITLRDIQIQKLTEAMNDVPEEEN